MSFLAFEVNLEYFFPTWYLLLKRAHGIIHDWIFGWNLFVHIEACDRIQIEKNRFFMHILAEEPYRIPDRTCSCGKRLGERGCKYCRAIRCHFRTLLEQIFKLFFLFLFLASWMQGEIIFFTPSIGWILFVVVQCSRPRDPR